MSTVDPSTPLVVSLHDSIEADRELLGGKGASLARMTGLGIPVPPAFTLTTAACRRYQADGRRLSDPLWAEVSDALDRLETQTGQRFGGIGGQQPLLVSVRSGAPVSMPGMMDTLLNVGLTRPALDRLRRELPARSDTDWLGDLETGVHETFVETPFAVLSAEREADAHAEAMAQLRWSIARIFDSWHNRRAEAYRRANAISDDLGTAVTVQAMVFGNRDERSGTGVYITRNPVTGANEPYGEWLPRAQGESLVSGEHSPLELSALDTDLPGAHNQLVTTGRRLEAIERHPMEIEFTVESGLLYLLQARRSTHTPVAAVRWVVDLVDDGLLSVAEALKRVDDETLRKANGAGDGSENTGQVLARGTGVVPGQCSGLVGDDPDEVDRLAAEEHRVILARTRTSPHDIHGFLASVGVITEQGGSTSHAAVVARQIGMPCVVGCGDGAVAAVSGRVVTVDGTHGVVYNGEPAKPHEQRSAGSPELTRLLRWKSACTDDFLPTSGREA